MTVWFEKGLCQHKTLESSWGPGGIILNNYMQRLFLTDSFKGENKLTERRVQMVGKWACERDMWKRFRVAVDI